MIHPGYYIGGSPVHSSWLIGIMRPIAVDQHQLESIAVTGRSIKIFPTAKTKGTRVMPTQDTEIIAPPPYSATAPPPPAYKDIYQHPENQRAPAYTVSGRVAVRTAPAINSTEANATSGCINYKVKEDN